MLQNYRKVSEVQRDKKKKLCFLRYTSQRYMGEIFEKAE